MAFFWLINGGYYNHLLFGMILQVPPDHVPSPEIAGLILTPSASGRAFEKLELAMQHIARERAADRLANAFEIYGWLAWRVISRMSFLTCSLST